MSKRLVIFCICAFLFASCGKRGTVVKSDTPEEIKEYRDFRTYIDSCPIEYLARMKTFSAKVVSNHIEPMPPTTIAYDPIAQVDVFFSVIVKNKKGELLSISGIRPTRGDYERVLSLQVGKEYMFPDVFTVKTNTARALASPQNQH